MLTRVSNCPHSANSPSVDDVPAMLQCMRWVPVPHPVRPFFAEAFGARCIERSLTPAARHDGFMNSRSDATPATSSTVKPALDRPDLERSLREEPGFRIHLRRWLVAVANDDGHLNLAEYQLTRAMAEEGGSTHELLPEHGSAAVAAACPAGQRDRRQPGRWAQPPIAGLTAARSSRRGWPWPTSPSRPGCAAPAAPVCRGRWQSRWRRTAPAGPWHQRRR